MPSKTVVVVTSNTTKFEELAEALSHHQIEAERIDFDIPEIKALDIKTVIADKVKKAYEKARRPVIVDDSGIFFDNYKEFPGTFTKFLYKTIGFEGIFRLVKPGDRAVFHSYIAYLDANLDESMLFNGQYAGTLTDQFDQSQDYEMPYAPMFIPDGEIKDMAAMTPLERAQDHRHQAINKFASWYNSER